MLQKINHRYFRLSEKYPKMNNEQLEAKVIVGVYDNEQRLFAPTYHYRVSDTQPSI